ncbi:MAG: hypothetical protein QW390_02510 [Candidatus Bathyarchaeia archaeon]
MRLSTSTQACEKLYLSRPYPQAYLYYCGRCGEGLALAEERCLDSVGLQMGSRCPRCRGDLSRTLREEVVTTPHRVPLLFNPLYKRPADRAASATPPTLPASRHPTLQSAGRRLLTFGDAELDGALPGFSPGSFILFYGSPRCLVLSEVLCARAQLPPRLGGLGSAALFLDAGNSFDPYLISDYARQRGLDAYSLLDGIYISRAFTYPQLTSLITGRLPEAVEKYGAGLVVVSDIATLYRSPPRHASDAAWMFRRAVSSLLILAQEMGIIAIATQLSPIEGGGALEEALLHHAQVVARVEEEPAGSLRIEKHNLLAPRTVPLGRSPRLDEVTPII